MKCEPCTFLPDMAAAYLPTSSLDTRQWSLLSGTDMPAKSCANEPPMDGFPACECMKGTLACSIHPSTPEAWTAFMQASLAKTLALLESRQAYLKAPDQAFTAKSCASLAWYDQSSCSWKTSQQSLVTDWEPYSETWPRWGMTAGGSAFAHPMSERRIIGTDGFYWQTPVADDSVDRAKGKINSRGEPKLSAQVLYPTPCANSHTGAGHGPGKTGAPNLQMVVAMWPTPTTDSASSRKTRYAQGGLPLSLAVKMYPTATATAYKGWSPGHNRSQTDDRLDYTVEREAFGIGQSTPPMRLNPYWVEWLQGFPIGFTVSKDWVTPKSRSKPQPPIDFLVANSMSQEKKAGPLK